MLQSPYLDAWFPLSLLPQVSLLEVKELLVQRGQGGRRAQGPVGARAQARRLVVGRRQGFPLCLIASKGLGILASGHRRAPLASGVWLVLRWIRVYPTIPFALEAGPTSSPKTQPIPLAWATVEGYNIMSDGPRGSNYVSSDLASQYSLAGINPPSG